MKKIFLSLLGAGYLPKMPGTWGSMLSAVLFALAWPILPAAWFLKLPLLLIIFLSVYLLAVRFTADVITDHDYDKQWIVIDEFLGIMISCLPFWLTASFSWWLLLAGLVLFRIFDIWKPWGIKRIDHQNTPNSVMLDDVLAAVYALIIEIIGLALFWLGTLFL